MEFNIRREALLNVLQPVVGVVEKRQTLPILSNVLFSVSGDKLSVTATDLEVEMIAHTKLEGEVTSGDITVPGRKLMDICRNQPEEVNLKIFVENQKVMVKAAKGRYSLSTLPATEYPSVEDSPGVLEFSMLQKDLRFLIERTHFAMAHQDVRYYLNGILLEVDKQQIRCVATDGHRLALCSVALDLECSKHQVIVPRKGIVELLRLIQDSDDKVDITVGSNHIRAAFGDVLFTSKLIDGRFPDFDKVIPQKGESIVKIERDLIKSAFNRVSILCNEKFKGIRVQLKPGLLKITASNPEHEEAEEDIELPDYSGSELEIGFNVRYLLDVLNTVAPGDVTFTFTDSNSSVVIREAGVGDSIYVVMPMRL